MKRLYEEDVMQYADENGLECVSTTSERSGYPRNVSVAIIGFDTFEDAEKAQSEIGGHIEHLESRDGWDLWYRTSNWANEAYKINGETFGDCYDVYSAEEKEFYKEQEMEYINELRASGDEDEAERADKLEVELKDMLDAFDELGENEGLVLLDNSYYGTTPLETMSYCFDTHHYAIGLVFYDVDFEDFEE